MNGLGLTTGMCTLLFSVPVSSLQIWGNDETWRYVKYEPGSLVVNIGETLGGFSFVIRFGPDAGAVADGRNR